MKASVFGAEDLPGPVVAVTAARGTGRAGLNKIAWNRKLGGKPAKPGSYKLTVTITNQGRTAKSTIATRLH